MSLLSAKNNKPPLFAISTPHLNHHQCSARQHAQQKQCSMTNFHHSLTRCKSINLTSNKLNSDLINNNNKSIDNVCSNSTSDISLMSRSSRKLSSGNRHGYSSPTMASSSKRITLNNKSTSSLIKSPSKFKSVSNVSYNSKSRTSSINNLNKSLNSLDEKSTTTTTKESIQLSTLNNGENQLLLADNNFNTVQIKTQSQQKNNHLTSLKGNCNFFP
jgi:hypothetical protein